MKKDIWIMSLRIIIGLSLLAYIIYLYINQADIIPTKSENYDITIYIIVWILACILIFIWIMKTCFKKPRTLQVIMWIFIILFVNYVWLKDNPSANIFIKDILSVIWVIITILWFTKVCIYDKCQKKQEETEMEIIEV